MDDIQNAVTNDTQQVSAPSAPVEQATQQQPQQQPQQAAPAQQPGTPSTTATPLQRQDPQQPQHITAAQRVRDIAQVMAGGPRVVTVSNPDGSVSQQRVPLSGRQIGLAIALEALTGGLAGLGAKGPNHLGQAAALGLQQGQRMQQQKQEREDVDYERARQQQEDRYKKVAQQAAVAEVNSRTILNTSEAEHFGLDALSKLIEINRPAVDALDDNAIDGRQITQSELLDGMQSGKYNATDTLGPIDGVRQVQAQDGSTRYEGTHVVVKDPNSTVMITPAMYDKYAAAGIPGFPPNLRESSKTFDLKFSTLQRANEMLAAHTLSEFRLNDLRQVLNGTPYADKVPATVDFRQPGTVTALSRFQRYVSHADTHGMDVYESLQAMGAAKRDPKTGEMQPNPDAKYVDTVAQTFGGWAVLQAAHDQLAANKKAAEDFAIIDTEAKANAVLSSPAKFSSSQIKSAQTFLTLSAQQGVRKAADDARERAVAEGRDVEAMYKTGVNPITKERLSLDNAPLSMLVDSKGRPVPQNQQSLYKPSQSEKQTADTARQALAISADLRAAVKANPNLVGPLAGSSKKGLASLGLGEEQAQKMLDDVAFLQSAATKVHTGRFSNEILKKMSNMIFPGMSAAQFGGALDSMDEVMNRYAQEDQLITVADYKAMSRTAPATQGLTNIQVNPKTGQQIGWDGKHWVDLTTRRGVR